MHDEAMARIRILEEALRLFSTKGYEVVGVQEICVAAGITKPTLYYHFGSKAGLLGTILDEHYRRLDEEVERAAEYRGDPGHYERDVYPTLLRVCMVYFTYALREPELYRMQLALAVAPAESDAARIVAYRNRKQEELLRSMMKAIGRRHGNVGRHAEQTAAILLGVINAQIVLHFNGNGRLDEATARSAVRLYMHGMFS